MFNVKKICSLHASLIKSAAALDDSEIERKKSVYALNRVLGLAADEVLTCIRRVTGETYDLENPVYDVQLPSEQQKIVELWASSAETLSDELAEALKKVVEQMKKIGGTDGVMEYSIDTSSELLIAVSAVMGAEVFGDVGVDMKSCSDKLLKKVLIIGEAPSSSMSLG